MILKEQLKDNLKLVREQKPLVHNITNFVVMNNTANALLAIGASPVMAHSINEVEDMVNISSSLVINMGTISDTWVEGMLLAGRAAVKKGIPVIFDPVGVGATPYRNEMAHAILKQCKPAIIRGNASEILALAKENVTTKGVDSTASSDSALEAAKQLAQECKTVVVISGEHDFITDGKDVYTVKNGSKLMPFVTGMGCTATAILGAFAAVNSNFLCAAIAGMTLMGIAGEIAEIKSDGPGTMQVNFIDTLYRTTALTLDAKAHFGKLSNAGVQ